MVHSWEKVLFFFSKFQDFDHVFSILRMMLSWWLHQAVTFSIYLGSLPHTEGMRISTSGWSSGLPVGSELLLLVEEFKYLWVLFTRVGWSMRSTGGSGGGSSNAKKKMVMASWWRGCGLIQGFSQPTFCPKNLQLYGVIMIIFLSPNALEPARFQIVNIKHICYLRLLIGLHLAWYPW